MSAQAAWETAILAASRWCEGLVKLDFLGLSSNARKWLANALGIASVLVVVLLVLDIKEAALILIVPIAILWVTFFAAFFLLYLPTLAVKDLYFYLVNRGIPFGYAAPITLLTLVGGIALFLVFVSWSR